MLIKNRLAPEEGAVFLRAIEDARRSVRGTHADQPATKERAEAVVLMAERSLSADGRGSAADRTQVVVHVDAAVLADPRLPMVVARSPASREPVPRKRRGAWRVTPASSR